jgi:hypothetical protein
MKKFSALALFSLIAIFFSGCAVVGGIFKAGVWVGILAVVAVIVIIILIVRGMSNKS